VVAAATARGLPVAAHAHSTAATAAAAHAGVTSIEHCRWLTSACFDDPDLNDGIATAIAETGIFVTPTIGTNYQLNEQRRPGFVEHQTRVLRWQDTHGIRIMNGTDAGVSPFHLYPHHRYLEAFQRAGFAHPRILDILTRESAAGLGLADRIGTLGHGYSADLIVVDGDPVTDLTALRRPLLVVARGRRHTPGSSPLAADLE
jgi:imidazolonepropionase-like amidohydrolase